MLVYNKHLLFSMHGMNIKVLTAPVLCTDGVLSLDCSLSSRWYWHCI